MRRNEEVFNDLCCCQFYVYLFCILCTSYMFWQCGKQQILKLIYIGFGWLNGFRGFSGWIFGANLNFWAFLVCVSYTQMFRQGLVFHANSERQKWNRKRFVLCETLSYFTFASIYIWNILLVECFSFVRISTASLWGRIYWLGSSKSKSTQLESYFHCVAKYIYDWLKECLDEARWKSV